MASESLVVQLVDDGHRLIHKLKHDGVTVKVAFWMKSDESDRWTLFIASPMVDADGPIAAYRKIDKALQSISAAKLVLSDVSAIGEDAPLAAHAMSAAGGGNRQEGLYLYSGSPLQLSFTSEPLATQSNRLRFDANLPSAVVQSNRPE